MEQIGFPSDLQLKMEALKANPGSIDPLELRSIARKPDFAKFAGFLYALRYWEKSLKKIIKSDQPLIVGPWISEVGFELLYWIPFLQWVKEVFEIPAERIHVISRGGARSWYAGITNNYYEIFDHMSVEDFHSGNQQRISEVGGQKQTHLSGFESNILERVMGRDLNTYRVIEPGLMYNMFRYFWRNRMGLDAILARTSFAPFALPGKPSVLPDDYYAVKLYFSMSFQKNQESVEFSNRLISKLRKSKPVVLLNTQLKIDDHSDGHIDLESSGHPVIDLSQHMRPNNNLEIQTAALAHASSFWGTYGGFSYLPIFFGKSSTSFYNCVESFLPSHLHLITKVVQTLRKDRNLDCGFNAISTAQVSPLLSL